MGMTRRLQPAGGAGRSGEGQQNGESGPFFREVLRSDLSAEFLDRTMADRKPQPDAFLFPSPDPMAVIRQPDQVMVPPSTVMQDPVTKLDASLAR